MLNQPLSTYLKKLFCKKVAYAAALIIPLFGYASFAILLPSFILEVQSEPQANTTQNKTVIVDRYPNLLSIRSIRTLLTQPEQDIISQSNKQSIGPNRPWPDAPPTVTAVPTDIVSTDGILGLIVPTDLPIPTVAATATALPTSTPLPPTPTNTPLPEPTAVLEATLKHVIIISIDGLRPDALFLAVTPHLDSLKERGAYSPYAQTIPNSITLPSHASMLSGMVPEKHGIEWGLPYIGWPGMAGPTLFTAAKHEGMKTAMVFGKDKLHYIAIENSVDQVFGGDVHDTDVKEWAIEAIQTDMPNAMFIHFPDTDRVGHTYGWMSENQLYAITFVDGLIGEIMAELKRQGHLENTMFIVSSDHGGQGFGHGNDSPLDRTIPWLAAGPGIKEGILIEGEIDTYDTGATAAYALGLPVPPQWDGQPLLEIFEDE